MVLHRAVVVHGRLRYPYASRQCKKVVTACNERYVERMLKMVLDVTMKSVDPTDASGEQRRLNAIVAALKFED